MSKSITAGMTTHLQGPGTTLAICWKVTRRDDGRVFGFTAHDQDIEFEGVTYVARSGFRRTAIANSSNLAVDNLDVTGILNDSEITVEDLRNGRYDRAGVQIFAVNYENLAHGAIKLRAGQFGEIKVNHVGTFYTELRGMTQRLAHNFLPQYQPTCRNDLGDSNCTVPINPPLALRNTAYAVGDFVRAANGAVGFPLVFPMDDDTGDEALGRLPVTSSGANQQFNKSKMKFGNGAIEFLPSGSVNPAQSFLFYSDSALLELGASDFTIELWVRFNSLADGTQIAVSKWTNTGNQRAWRLGIISGLWAFRASSDGITEDLALDALYAAIDINTWYHVAVERTGNTFTLYVDGVPHDTLTSAFTVVASTAELRFGKQRANGGDDAPLFGLVDDARITVGEAYYTDNYLIDIYGEFEPPTAAHPAPGFTQEAYENRIYECTTAGTTHATVQPTFDTVVGNTTADGTVVFTAREAFMRHATIGTVTNQRTFTLSGLVESRAVDDWFNGGVLQFEDGDNAGRRIEIKDWVNATSTITLWDDAFYTLTAGTKVRLYPGCNKTRTHCKTKFVIPDSTDFADGNMRNFDGEPDVPGEDFFLQAGSPS